MAASTPSIFDILAEPRRREILELLREHDESPVGALVSALGLSQPAVSKHLRVLRQANLVSSRVDAQRRVYRINPTTLRELDEWLAPYRTLWSRSLDAPERALDRPDVPQQREMTGDW